MWLVGGCGGGGLERGGYIYDDGRGYSYSVYLKTYVV